MWNKLILLIIGLSICFTINGQIIKSYHLEYGVLKTSYELIEKGNIDDMILVMVRGENVWEDCW